MTIRQELETILATFAAAQIPPIPVAWEGIDFIKPTDGQWLEMYLLSANTISSDVAASRIRERGTLSVIAWSKSGEGTRKIELLVEQISKLFPVVPKVGTVSIEAPGNSGRITLDNSGWICLPITFPYRQESLA
jgi:hypothetical protein